MFGKLNNSLGCRERQAHNGNVCSLVFAPAILFNGRKIWVADGIAFVVHGHEVCVRDVWELGNMCWRQHLTFQVPGSKVLLLKFRKGSRTCFAVHLADKFF